MKSAMQHCCEHAMTAPTVRTRARHRVIPTASEVKTDDYLYQLKKTMWDRLRARKVR